MVLRVGTGHDLPRRQMALVLVLATVVGVTAAGPASALADQADEPAIEQYADPFGPLGTGRRAPGLHPPARNTSLGPSERLRRRLARTEDGEVLAVLLGQLEAERARTGDGAAPTVDDREPTGRTTGQGTGRGDEAPGVLDAVAGSVFDDGDPRGVLLLAGLIGVAAGGAAAAWVRGRSRAAG